MITFEEFQEASAVSGRRELRRLLWPLGLAAAVCAAAFAASLGSESFSAWYVESVGDHWSFLLLGLTAVAAVTLFLAAVLHWMGRKDRKDHRLRCPHCDHRLGTAAVATGNCGWCGGQALVPTGRGESLEDNPRVTVEQFNGAVAVARKRTLLGLGAVIFWFFAWFGLLVATKPLIRDPWLAWLGPGWTESDAMFLLALPAFAGLFGGMGFLAFREARRPRDVLVTCPQCQAHLEEVHVAHAVVATRRCQKCATAILADPDAATQCASGGSVGQAPQPPLLSLEEFRQAHSAHSRWILFF